MGKIAEKELKYYVCSERQKFHTSPAYDEFLFYIFVVQCYIKALEGEHVCEICYFLRNVTILKSGNVF